MFGLSTLEVVRGKAYETSCWTTLSMSKVKVCAKGLEYKFESEISTMRNFNYYSEVHVKPMNNNYYCHHKVACHVIPLVINLLNTRGCRQLGQALAS